MWIYPISGDWAKQIHEEKFCSLKGFIEKRTKKFPLFRWAQLILVCEKQEEEDNWFEQRGKTHHTQKKSP